MKRVKAGTSKAEAAKRRKLFIEAYCTNGGNGTEAAKAAGFAPKSAECTASRLLRDAKVSEAVEARRAEVLAKAQEKTQLTADEVLASLARDIRFDPAKLYDESGALKAIHEMDEDTRLALRGLEVDQIKVEGIAIGHTVKAKFPEKTAAREQGMKHFGLYKEDNAQRPALPECVLIEFVEPRKKA